MSLHIICLTLQSYIPVEIDIEWCFVKFVGICRHKFPVSTITRMYSVTHSDDLKTSQSNYIITQICTDQTIYEQNARGSRTHTRTHTHVRAYTHTHTRARACIYRRTITVANINIFKINKHIYDMNKINASDDHASHFGMCSAFQFRKIVFGT